MLASSTNALMIELSFIACVNSKVLVWFHREGCYWLACVFAGMAFVSGFTHRAQNSMAMTSISQPQKYRASNQSTCPQPSKPNQQLSHPPFDTDNIASQYQSIQQTRSQPCASTTSEQLPCWSALMTLFDTRAM
jgi:hypothetical protein